MSQCDVWDSRPKVYLQIFISLLTNAIWDDKTDGKCWPRNKKWVGHHDKKNNERSRKKKTIQACISKYSNKDRFQLLTWLACPQHCTAIIYSYTKTNRGFCFCDRVLLPVWEGIKSSYSFSVFWALFSTYIYDRVDFICKSVGFIEYVVALL